MRLEIENPFHKTVTHSNRNFDVSYYLYFFPSYILIQGTTYVLSSTLHPNLAIQICGQAEVVICVQALTNNITSKSTVRNVVPGLPPRDDRHQGGAGHELPQCPQHQLFQNIVDLLDEFLNIFNMLGTSTPLEKNIHVKASYLRKACKDR